MLKRKSGLASRDAVPAELLEPADSAERERLLADADADIAAGNFTPGDEVADWLLKLAAGRYAQPPCDR